VIEDSHIKQLKGNTMHQVKYRFIDKNGKTRKTMLVTFNRNVAVQIEGNASELQAYAAIDGGADSVGSLRITQQFIEE
jgi:hypothetical protein